MNHLEESSNSTFEDEISATPQPINDNKNIEEDSPLDEEQIQIEKTKYLNFYIDVTIDTTRKRRMMEANMEENQVDNSSSPTQTDKNEDTTSTPSASEVPIKRKRGRPPKSETSQRDKEKRERQLALRQQRALAAAASKADEANADGNDDSNGKSSQRFPKRRVTRATAEDGENGEKSKEDDEQDEDDDLEEEDEEIEEDDEIDPEELKQLRLNAIKNASNFNAFTLKKRQENGAFYYDIHTRTTQVINSWLVNLVYTEEYLEKQRKLQEEQIRKELINKYGMSDLKMNVPQPQAALSGFMLFSKKMRPSLKENHPDMILADMAKSLGSHWKNLSEAEKRKWEDRAELDKIRYKNEMQEYNDKMNKVREELLKVLPGMILDGMNIENIEFSEVVPVPKMSYDPAYKSKEKPTRTCTLCSKEVSKTNTESTETTEKSEDTSEPKSPTPPESADTNNNNEIINVTDESKEESLPDSGPESYFHCDVCRKYFHTKCLHFSKERVQKIIQYDRKKWKCGDCKSCEVCGKRTKLAKDLLTCDVCDRFFHNSCLQSPLHKMPSGRWVCPDCVYCVSCGTKKPGKEGSGSKSKWCDDYTLCRSCHLLIQDNKYCPICKKAYRNDDTTPMVQCDNCDFWIHTACDNISDQEYKKLNSSRLLYLCPTCRVIPEAGRRKRKEKEEREDEEIDIEGDTDIPKLRKRSKR